MSLEATLRAIVREEIRAVVAELQGKAAPAPGLMNSADLCDSLGISRGTLRKMMAEGCPHVRPGTYPRFDLEHVKRWMNAR